MHAALVTVTLRRARKGEELFPAPNGRDQPWGQKSVTILSPAELAQQVGEPYALCYRPPVRTDLDVALNVEELSPDTSTGTPTISISNPHSWLTRPSA